MEGYELGKDIQEIKQSLRRIEAALGSGGGGGDQEAPEETSAVSLEVKIDIRWQGEELCAKVRVKIKTPLGNKDIDLPEVCLGADGVCSSVTTGDTNPYARTEVCWRGAEICAEVTAGAKIAGRSYEASASKCVGI